MLTRCIFVIISDARADMQMERERERERRAKASVGNTRTNPISFRQQKKREIYILLLSYCRINGFFGIDG